MGIVHEIFGKAASAVTMDDVQQFFEGKPLESQRLEFKSGDVDLTKLQKEVCAFLNAEGGLLIMGAPRESDATMKLELNHFPNDEILYRQITQGIVPVPEGVRVAQIPGDDGSVFLVEVPPSHNTPHQLQGSGTYYMRQGAIARPALHEEVERMFMDRRKANLDLQIEIERPDDALIIRLIIGNKSSISAYEPGFNFICTPVRFQDNSRFQVQNLARDNYLAEGQQWMQELEVYPSEPRFFIYCEYYCRDLSPRIKAAFAEILNNKVELLQIFNSDVHQDYHLWYEENLYLLND